MATVLQEKLKHSIFISDNTKVWRRANRLNLFIYQLYNLRDRVSKLVCDCDGDGGRGGEEVHDDSEMEESTEVLVLGQILGIKLHAY